MIVSAGLWAVMNPTSHLKLLMHTTELTELQRTYLAYARAASLSMNRGERAFPRGTKAYNQLAKACRRRAFGKPSYRQRQASARAAKRQSATV
jgi:hypothetical protein